MSRSKIIIPALLVSTLSLIFSCSTKNEDSGDHSSHESAQGEWKGMDDFHMVMAESFHPYKDSANLEPAKANASSLASSAEKWASAPLPEKFEGDDEIEFKLKQLQKDAVSFSETVNSGDEKAIGESLTKLHDLFHELQESWYGGHSEKDH